MTSPFAPIWIEEIERRREATAYAGGDDRPGQRRNDLDPPSTGSRR
ncbi:hypothetical protein [Ruania halotolerans]|nr:hypothetical protein [Ruania halotolerans]UFU07320.1 hypothetical protein LQF10_04200 [Ruania halotolerans]